MKEINEDNIRVAAYYIWEQAGRPEGAEKECWIKAVEQLFAAKPSKKGSEKAEAKSASKPAAKALAKKPAAKKTPDKKPAAKPAAAAPVFYGVKKK